MAKIDEFAHVAHLRKVRKVRYMRNFATSHLNYLRFTSTIIFGVVEVLETPKSTKMSQNEPKSTILRHLPKVRNTRILAENHSFFCF